MIVRSIGCLWLFPYWASPRMAKNILLPVLVTAAATVAIGQSVSARLEIEAITGKEFGRVLSVRTVITNETSNHIFLTNFLSALDIERLNDKNQFENYFDYWFATLLHDSTRSVIEDRYGVGAEGHDATYDIYFLRELDLANQGAADADVLRVWCDRQIDQIETIKAHGVMQFQTNLNSLPPGKYRLRFFYVSKTGGVPILPTEEFRSFIIPDSLLSFVRWTDSIDSGYIYLTIR